MTALSMSGERVMTSTNRNGATTMKGHITKGEALQVIKDAIASSTLPRSHWSIHAGKLNIMIGERVVQISIPRNQTFYALESLRKQVVSVIDEARRERDARQIDLEQYLKQTAPAA